MKFKIQLITQRDTGEEIQELAYLAVQQRCPRCAQAFRHKDQHPLVFRTLFGNLEFPSPRWFQCACQPHETRTFSPLANLLPEHCSPERLYLSCCFRARNTAQLGQGKINGPSLSRLAVFI